ncbi:MAG: prepilin-type N-terminal cleavage/methylation domain-containing protein [Gemmatimonadetes bacterium]|nr:prepilin-type N-terminal cleavage/methylation domain-containing protein [Gemmatimonadota bacterium]
MKRVGFTLLEAVVAMAIVGTVSIGALGALAAESRAAARARDTAPAAALARERVARLELVSRHTLAFLPDSLSHGEAAAGTQLYKWVATAKPVSQEHDLFDVAVEVQWAGGAFTLRTRTWRPPDVAPLAGASP